MSRKKHKSRKSKQNDRYSNENLTYNNPFGLNPAQLLSLLGGGDMNFLTNMLSNMGQDGVDLGGLFSNLNTNNGIDNRNCDDISDSYDYKEYDFKNNDGEYTSTRNEDDEYEEDENVDFLKSVRKIADPKRKRLLDKIIEKYLDGEFN